VYVAPDVPSGIFSCDDNGNPKEQFAPNETVRVKGNNLAANTNYTLWIQTEPVSENDPLDPDEDPSGLQEEIMTAANGSLAITEIWHIPQDAQPTFTE
jgi:hypothetical protein